MSKISSVLSFSAICFPATLAFLPVAAGAQCTTEPAGNTFRAVTLISAGQGSLNSGGESEGPVQMAVAPDGRVFLAKMSTGEIRVFTGTNNATTLAGTVPVFFDTEDGLLGIALAHDFATTNWLYAFFSEQGQGRCVLSRFTVNASNQLTNRKDLLRMTRESSTRHGAGGLAMDAAGNLVFGTGDNTDPFDMNGYAPTNQNSRGANAERSSSNSNDLRGKIVRVKPIAFPDNQTPAIGIGTTYDVPAGNLWERINNTTFNPGWDGTDNINLVRKEIFSMGHRNPYHVRVDTRTGWIFWGEVGPDGQSDDAQAGPAGYDEWNLAKGPGFYGHPYCNGPNRAWGIPTKFTSPYTYSGFYNCAAPVNNSSVNTGVHHLPPSVPSLIAYRASGGTGNDTRFGSGAETNISGPMYRFNPSSSSTVKFPAYYEGKILFFDYSRPSVGLKFLVLNYPDGTIPAGTAGVRDFNPTSFIKDKIIDAQFAPAGQYEGSLYLLRFADAGDNKQGALIRVEFTGTYDNSCYQPFGPPTGVFQRSVAPPALARGSVILPNGYHGLELFDVSGRKVWGYSREAAAGEFEVKLPGELSQGMWQARFTP